MLPHRTQHHCVARVFTGALRGRRALYRGLSILKSDPQLYEDVTAELKWGGCRGGGDLGRSQ
jgi:hypothetical protein